MGFFDPFEAAIFDLDGTLVDSMSLWEQVFRNWQFSLNRAPDREAAEAVKNMALTQSAEFVVRRFGLGIQPETVISQWESLALDEYREKVPLKNGAGELVRALAARGMKLGIATSSFPAACEAVLGRHGIREFFSSIIYTDEIKSSPGNAGESGKVRGKGFPDIWLAAASRLGVAPSKCVVFEDLRESLKGCRAAGIGAFIAVYDGTAPDWQELRREADLALDSPGGALDLLQSVLF
ncbi:MAG: HAD family phosphatase [Treponema sp.]|jgi:beta-phosphoglucomutase-like phosphatase (HAD superfamily)|nr:HAD family phosphatase [Treponema sp.]